MLVAISGSQGSGKTTVLTRLSALGFNVTQRKTARSLLNEMGKTLDMVYDTPESTMEWQTAVLRRKMEDEAYYVTGDGIWFTERTYADLFSYALMYVGRYNRCDVWLNQYYKECMRAQQTYDMVFYLKAGRFEVAADGTRGHNPHYSRMSDIVMQDVTTTMTRPSKLVVIDTPILEQRADIITATLPLSHNNI